MRKSWIAVAVVAAACGGGKDQPDASTTPIDTAIDTSPPIDMAIDSTWVLPDAAVDAAVVVLDAPADSPAPGPCNLLTQAGCSGGEKCTWIHDQDNPPIGHIGCAPDGAIAAGGACTAPTAGPAGYDNCVEGTYCLRDVCKPLCDPNGGAPTCGTSHKCMRYADTFESGGVAQAGLCEPICDPLTQDVSIGSPTTACGSIDPANPDRGCYGYDSFACSAVGATVIALTDRMMPRTNASGNPYLNGCAPGFIPLFYAMTGSTQTLCTGFCAVLEVDNTPAHVNNSLGSTTALAKMPTALAPIAGDGTCAPAKKGSHASSTCRFMWPYLLDDITGDLPAEFPANLVDTLGVCMAIAFFQYDSNFDLTPDTPYPSCTTLPPRSLATTTDFDDAADWGCQRRANSMFTSLGKPGVNRAMRDITIGGTGGPMPIVRHRFE